jgi:hypothetical protein
MSKHDDLADCIKELGTCVEWLARCFSKVYPSGESAEVFARVTRHLDAIRSRLGEGN